MKGKGHREDPAAAQSWSCLLFYDALCLFEIISEPLPKSRFLAYSV